MSNKYNPDIVILDHNEKDILTQEEIISEDLAADGIDIYSVPEMSAISEEVKVLTQEEIDMALENSKDSDEFLEEDLALSDEDLYTDLEISDSPEEISNLISKLSQQALEDSKKYFAEREAKEANELEEIILKTLERDKTQVDVEAVFKRVQTGEHQILSPQTVELEGVRAIYRDVQEALDDLDPLKNTG